MRPTLREVVYADLRERIRALNEATDSAPTIQGDPDEEPRLVFLESDLPDIPLAPFLWREPR